MATLHSSSPGPAVRPNFPPSNFTLFQRIFGAISVNTHGELLKLMQMKLKSVKNATQMTLQSYVAKAYMLSYIQQKSVEFYYVLQATSKTAPTDLNRKNVFFQKWNGGFIQLGKMVSIDKISASNSKFENLRWTPQYQQIFYYVLYIMYIIIQDDAYEQAFVYIILLVVVCISISQEVNYYYYIGSTLSIFLH